MTDSDFGAGALVIVKGDAAAIALDAPLSQRRKAGDCGIAEHAADVEARQFVVAASARDHDGADAIIERTAARCLIYFQIFSTMLHPGKEDDRGGRMKLLIFQFGDFGEAYWRFKNGGAENYRDQKSSVDYVAALAKDRTVITVAICDRSYEEELQSGLVAIGISPDDAYDHAAVEALLDRLQPDSIICRTPNLPVLKWAARRRVPTLPLFADIFLNDNPRSIVRNLRLRWALARGHFPCVANHSLNASISVNRALLWPDDKVIPWDWTRMRVEDRSKSLSTKTANPSALFCGALSESKGLGDCLEALRILKNEGVALELTVAGPGDIEPWRSLARKIGIGSQVEFAGLISHGDVRKHMREKDVVLVPSRHDYAEGLPNTIYEALAARTPLIMSDHPAFAGRLVEGQDALVFRAADPRSLATSVSTLLGDAKLYERLSQRSKAAHDSLYVGMEFEELVSAFLDDPDDKTNWVKRNSLSAIAGSANAAKPT